MISQMFALYDTKAAVYNKPFPVVNKEVAIRSLSEYLANGNKQDDVIKHPEDFILYELGAYDDGSGKLTAHNEPIHIARCSEVLLKTPHIETETERE